MRNVRTNGGYIVAGSTELWNGECDIYILKLSSIASEPKQPNFLNPVKNWLDNKLSSVQELLNMIMKWLK